MIKYIENLAKALLGVEYSELTKAEKNVIESIANQEPVVSDVNEQFSEKLSFGQRLADKVAAFGRSY